MNKNKSLRGKDLITIGIFSALYFAISLACNMLGGFHAIIWFLSPMLAAIFCATPFLLMCAKSKRPLSVLIMGIVIGLIYFATGQFHILVPITFFVVGIIAELIRKMNNYNSFNNDAIAFVVFSLGMIASPIPLWLDTDSFIAQIKEFGMPQSYVDTVTSMTSIRMLIIMIGATFIGSLIGIFFTKKMFKKHFVKAGLV